MLISCTLSTGHGSDVIHGFGAYVCVGHIGSVLSLFQVSDA